MIDQDALKRDAQADIADWPIQLRHYYNATQFDQVTCGLNATDDMSLLMDGGLLERMDGEIMAIADDFVNGFPKNRDRVDILQADGVTWLRFEVKHTPDVFDPLGATYQFRIGSPAE
jgi:hypothetical protein